MAEEKSRRLGAVAREFNVAAGTIVNYLTGKGFKVENNPNQKIDSEQYGLLSKEFSASAQTKQEAQSIKPAAQPEPKATPAPRPAAREEAPKPAPKAEAPAPAPAPPAPAPAAQPAAPQPAEEQRGLKVVGKIDLEALNKPKKAEPASQPAQPAAQQPAPKPAGPAQPEASTPAPATPATPPAAEKPAPPAAQPSAPAQPAAEKPAAPAASAPAEQPVQQAQPAKPAAEKAAAQASAEQAQQAVPTANPQAAAPQPAADKPAARPADKAADKPAEKPADKTAAKPAAPAAGGAGGGAKQGPRGDKPADKGGDKPADRAADKGGERSGDRPAQARPQGGQPAQAAQPAAGTPAAPAGPATPPPAGDSPEQVEPELIRAKADELKGLTVLGKIQLPVDKPRGGKGGKPGPGNASDGEKRQRKRIKMGATPVSGSAQPGQQQGQGQRGPGQGGDNRGPRPGGPGQGQRGPGQGGQRGGNDRGRPGQRGPGQGTGTGQDQPKEITAKQLQENIKNTMARMGGANRPQANRSKYRQEKRRGRASEREEARLAEEQEAGILRITEYITVSDLAALMDVPVNEVIQWCFSNGMMVSINQRLEADDIQLIAAEFEFTVEFVNAEEEEQLITEEADDPATLVHRAPIVTIMGHVDHGKTSLLDYIRKTKVVAGEAGGITQHIGAYDVMTSSGKRITFLDTPGHEAFTAMRARGAKVTDIAIIVVAADDAVMPQTKEAINHARAANVPIVIAINKIDKPAADPERIKQQLAQENILVEDWGGKYQVEHISAKSGQGVEELLEKVLLEAEILELKANPDRKANGTIIEASLDKGRGYVATVLVQNGTLRQGDIMLSGQFYGRIRAMSDHKGARLKEAGPGLPVQVLGLDGAPTAGERFNIMETDREARELANRRSQLLREQTMRTRKHITLEDIVRQKAKGELKRLNLIVKGDVDGSVQALGDSLLKLTTVEVEVNIIHKAVGPISESDVQLAVASNAIIIGFQVRPSAQARRMAEDEQIEVRTYSVIYAAIDDVKAAMEGMLDPKVEEVFAGQAEIRQVFRISNIGTVAGAYVQEGSIKRNHKVRLLREGIQVFEGEIDSLKRFKDDVSEVKNGYEFGISFKGFNDLKEGDVIEAVEEREVKRKLSGN